MDIQLIAILHDMMKPSTHVINKHGTDSYYGHEYINKDLLDNISNDLCLSNKEKDILRQTVYLHHIFKMCDTNNKKILFNCCYSFLISKTENIIDIIKPILWGDYNNFVVSKSDNKEIYEEFENKFSIIRDNIVKLKGIKKSVNWNKYLSNIPDERKQKEVKNKIKKIFLNN